MNRSIETRPGEEINSRGLLDRILDRVDEVGTRWLHTLRVHGTAHRFSDEFFKGRIGLWKAHEEIDGLEQEGVFKPGELSSRFDKVVTARAALTCPPNGPRLRY